MTAQTKKPPRTPAMDRVFAAMVKVSGLSEPDILAKEPRRGDAAPIGEEGHDKRAARKILIVALMYLCGLDKGQAASAIDRTPDDAVKARLFVRSSEKRGEKYGEKYTRWIRAVEQELGLDEDALITAAKVPQPR